MKKYFKLNVSNDVFMRILQVIHGYPPHYMAGSEVYTYNLARELAKSNEVFVFCRFEDKSLPLYQITDSVSDGVNIRYSMEPIYPIT